MSRGHYSAGKRAREAEKARKKKEKAERRQRRREEGPAEFEVVSAEDVTGSLPSIEEAMQFTEVRAERQKGSNSPPCRLFVGGLSWDTTEPVLRETFGKFGGVSDAIIVKDRNTGDSRGFGFVTMESRRDAIQAIDALNDSVLDGRTIVVNIATERER